MDSMSFIRPVIAIKLGDMQVLNIKFETSILDVWRVLCNIKSSNRYKFYMGNWWGDCSHKTWIAKGPGFKVIANDQDIIEAVEFDIDYLKRVDKDDCTLKMYEMDYLMSSNSLIETCCCMLAMGYEKETAIELSEICENMVDTWVCITNSNRLRISTNREDIQAYLNSDKRLFEYK